MPDSMRRHLCYLAAYLLLCASCGNRQTDPPPIKHTPLGARVDLEHVSLEVRGETIIARDNAPHLLRFQFTIHNESGAIISFPCLYHRIDELIEVNLTNRENKYLTFGKPPLAGLTLTEPQSLKIALNKTTLTFEAPIIAPLPNSSEPIEMRVRLHTPSRYDELRSSIEAPTRVILWP